MTEEKNYTSEEAKIVKDILLETSIPYSDDEISYLVKEIIKICKENNTPVTKNVVDRIRRNIESSHQKPKVKRSPEEIKAQREPRLARKNPSSSSETSEDKSQKPQAKRTSEELVAQREAWFARRRAAEGGQEMPSQSRRRSRMVGRHRYDDKLPAVAELRGHNVSNFLLDHFKNANWRSPGISNTTLSSNLRFDSNEGFWRAIIGNRQQVALNWVELTYFQIVDWFPRTPGLYHTHDASRARRMAREYVTEENGILFYKPTGKTHMIEGGVGSVRFKPILIEGEDCWLCTATTDGKCHSGIPLAIPNYLARYINLTSSDHYKIIGQVRYLPDFLEQHFYHMSRIPQMYVFVDSIKKMGFDKGIEVEITPMVFFEGDHRMELDGDKNVTYVKCPANSLDLLNQAVDWLKWYTERYRSRIITNFDQQMPFFKYAPFSLQNIMNGRINRREVGRYYIERADIVCDKVEKIYTEVATMSTIKVDIGDGNVFHGDVVVAEKIKNSFNNW